MTAPRNAPHAALSDRSPTRRKLLGRCAEVICASPDALCRQGRRRQTVERRGRSRPMISRGRPIRTCREERCGSPRGPGRPRRRFVIGSCGLGGGLDRLDHRSVSIDHRRAPGGVGFAIGGVGVIEGMPDGGGGGRVVVGWGVNISRGTRREQDGQANQGRKKCRMMVSFGEVNHATRLRVFGALSGRVSRRALSKETRCVAQGHQGCKGSRLSTTH